MQAPSRPRSASPRPSCRTPARFRLKRLACACMALFASGAHAAEYEFCVEDGTQGCSG